jgi:hypothetical protein
MIVAIVGAGRSGTNILASAFEHESPRFKNLYENRYVWSYGQRHPMWDTRTADEATPRVANRIRRHFQAQRDSSDRIMIDKTPSNAFRIPFVAAVFPDVRIINIIRDGRANVLSRARHWLGQRKGDDSGASPTRTVSGRVRIALDRITHLRQLLARGNLPASRLPALLRDYVPGVALQMLTGQPSCFGERIAGLRDILRVMGVDAAAAVQWRETVMAAHVGGRRLGPDCYLEIRYEDFVDTPGLVWERVLAFLDLPPTGYGTEYVEANVMPQHQVDWLRGPERERIFAVEPLLRPTLEYFDYSWD